jgi:hypothetical protein
LQIAESGFESHKLFGRQLTDPMAGRAAVVAFVKDGGKLAHRKTDGKRTANQPDASNCFGWI